MKSSSRSSIVSDDPARRQDKPHVVVIGGGISGLSAAYYLKQDSQKHNKPLSITLVEADQRLGGKLLTDQVNDFTIEGGPDCFLRQKPWATELAMALGLKDNLMGTNDHQRKIYVLNKGRMTPMPEGVMLIIPTRIMPFVLSPLISWPGKIRMGMDWFIPKYQGEGDESVGDFVRRRLGQEALDKIAEPMMSGIHVSDPEKQSLLATFPRFRGVEQKHGSLIRGMLAERKVAGARSNGAGRKEHGSRTNNGGRTGGQRPPDHSLPSSIFLTLRQGVGQLPRALESALSGCQILTGRRAKAISRQPGGTYQIELDSNQRLHAEALVLAIPAYDAAALIRSLQPEIAQELETISYVSTATLSLAFRKADIHKPFNGFGVVIPRKENRAISACTWSSFKFEQRAPADHLLLRCFFGGPGKEEMVDRDDEDLLREARRELQAILGLDAAPIISRLYRWRKANPQYDVGHLERVQHLFQGCQESLPGIVLTGSAYQGVGIPDCVHQGQTAALSVIEYLQNKE
jgi:oxygen-dependent protoporphyrinogen oxidase